jgi:hypothetical protein
MKQKSSNLSSQVLILTLAAIISLFMVQMARAQTGANTNNSQMQSWEDALKKSFTKMGLPKDPGRYLAQASANQNQQTYSTGSGINTRGGNTLTMKMPQKSGLSKFLEKTSVSYYQQFLGPTLSGPGGQTYNVFQETANVPNSGQAPIQSFHAMSVRYAINNDWAIGSSVAMANGYTQDVVNRAGSVNKAQPQWFNARMFVNLPSWKTSPATFFTTIAYEHPTSSISKNDGMTWGYVISENVSFNLPSLKWTAGLTGQIYRINYNHNVKRAPGMQPTQLQTMIVSGGPYVNYRFNDNWMLGSTVIVDWDQKGLQTGSREWGNNLPHRGRLTATYFPSNIKYLQSVGLFSQALLKFRPNTTVVGAEFALRF